MTLSKRKNFSSAQLHELKKCLTQIPELEKEIGLCIYTTGSYGRLEAGKFSDIDLFFLTDKKNNISRISKTIIDASIIGTCREMKFPEFSGDGEYLQVHIVDNILEQLGSRSDDYLNYFTARMLLLLESKPLYNEALYYKIINDILDRYYKDFDAHINNFQPIFLVNDVIRFWRTMCLNYEHSRSRISQIKTTRRATKEIKTKASIKNLKLKFSRKLTCYSLLLCLLWGKKLTKLEVIRLIGLTPMERLDELRQYREIQTLVDELVVLYRWFLDAVQKDADNLYIWISKESNKVNAFDQADKFGEIIVNIMLKTPYKSRLRYFLV